MHPRHKKNIISKDGTLLDLVLNLRSENFSLIKFRMTKNISQVWCKDCPSVGSNSHVLVCFLFLRLPRDLLETDLSDGERLEFSTDDTMRTRGVSLVKLSQNMAAAARHYLKRLMDDEANKRRNFPRAKSCRRLLTNISL